MQLAESQNIWSPQKFRLAMLPPAAWSKNNIGVNIVLTLRNILIVNTKIIYRLFEQHFHFWSVYQTSSSSH